MSIRKVVVLAGIASVGSTMAAQIARKVEDAGFSVVVDNQRSGKTEQLTQRYPEQLPPIGDFHRDVMKGIIEEPLNIRENLQQRRRKQKYINKPKSKFHR